LDDVLAGQARDIGAGPANVFAVDHGDAVAFSSKRPGGDSGTGAAAENHEIELFRLCHLNLGERLTGSPCSSCDFSFPSDRFTLGSH
jgi:hypothetical protein